MRVSEFWDQIFAEQLVGTGYGSYTTPWYAAAADGDVLANIGGSWSDALNETVPGGEGKWAVAPMPVWEDGMGYASGGHGGSAAAILANSTHPAESLEFLTWMCTDPAGIDAMIEFSGIGWSPAADYIGESRQEPSESFSGQNYNEEVIVPMAEGQNLEWTWAPLMQRVQNLIGDRSEEHTSELQSRGHIVCRLLLEKKKAKPTGSQRLLRYCEGRAVSERQ